jgi:hypothetical protein
MIDKFALDEECIKQNKLMAKVVEECIEAVESFNELSVELATKKAELDLMIRNEPEKYGLAKVTESAITAAITVAVQEIMEDLSKAESRKYAAILKKEEVLARGNDLKNLINLYLNDYYVQSTQAKMAENAEEVVVKQASSEKNKEITDKINKVKRVKKIIKRKKVE